MNLREKLAMVVVDIPITADELGEAIGEIALQGILRRGARIALEYAVDVAEDADVPRVDIRMILEELR